MQNVHPLASTSLSVSGGVLAWVSNTISLDRVTEWVRMVGIWAGSIAAVIGLILLLRSLPNRWKRKQ